VKTDAAIVAFRKGPIDPITDKPVSQNYFAKKVRLPPSVFSKYLKKVAADDVVDPPPSIAAGAAAAAAAQRRRSSGQVKKTLVGRPVQRFVVDVIVRMDRANDGMTCPEIYEMIESLCPHLTRLQCKRSFTETIRHRFRTELTGIVIAQKSTTKRRGHTATSWKQGKIVPLTLRRKVTCQPWWALMWFNSIWHEKCASRGT